MTTRSPVSSRPAAKRAKAVKAPATEVAAPAPQPVPPAVAEPVPAEQPELIAPIADPEPEAAPAAEVKGDKGRKKDKKKAKKEKKAKKAKKEAVLIRFDDDQLTAIDAQAEALGLSRAAWVRMVVAKALAGG